MKKFLRSLKHERRPNMKSVLCSTEMPCQCASLHRHRSASKSRRPCAAPFCWRVCSFPFSWQWRCRNRDSGDVAIFRNILHWNASWMCHDSMIFHVFPYYFWCVIDLGDKSRYNCHVKWLCCQTDCVSQVISLRISRMFLSGRMEALQRTTSKVASLLRCRF